MNSGRRSSSDSRHTMISSPTASPRLALPDEGEERRRASLYGHLLRRGGAALPPAGSLGEVAPPLQRGRMVPQRDGGHSLRRLLGRVLRPAVRKGPSPPDGEDR